MSLPERNARTWSRLTTRRVTAVVLIAGAGLAATAALVRADGTPPAAGEPISFNRQIRPILSDKCFTCHGPDSATRKAGLRFDRRDDALAEIDAGVHAIVPGDSAASELVRRITAPDADDRMPPPGARRQLTPAEIDLLTRWIDQGAAWEPHWAFIAPTPPDVPAVRDAGPTAGPVRNAIDAFIRARLEHEGLPPAPPADRETLIRRVTLDLTGLPPTLDEVDAFLADTSPVAYEKVVDRLLASPRYGEHMTRYWLDAARYGDTHGLHLDNRRSVWRWRDWVIDAYNRNLSFDRFTIEQVAGDLLPEPTLEQRIATGFNRNNVTTSEGGAINAEYLVKYAVDRVETTSTVWMGLTAGCAACHDHKFDPISQREFYRLFAFFNNVAERAMDGNKHDPPPVVIAPTPEHERELARLRRELAAAEARLDAPMPAVDAAQADWESEARTRAANRWEILDPDVFTSTGPTTFTKLDDRSLLAGGEVPAREVYEISARTQDPGISTLRIEALTHESLPHTGPGRSDNANLVLTEVEVEAVSVADPSQRRAVTLIGALADHEQVDGPYLAINAIDGIVDDTNGWAVEGFNRREDREIILAADAPFGFAGGTQINVRLRFESRWKGHAIGRVRLAVSRDADLHAVLAPSTLGPWHELGPFKAASGRAAFDTVYAPEVTPGVVDLAASFSTGDAAAEPRAWIERANYADGAVQNLPGGVNAATYLYRAIDAPSARAMRLSLGSDDAIKVWVNGRLVLDKYVLRPVAPDQEQVAIDLERGVNHVLMKIANAGGGYAFYFKSTGEGADRELLDVLELVARDPAALSDADRLRVRRYYRRTQSADLEALYDDVRTRKEAEADFATSLPITLVMAERDDRRDAFVLRRGNYDEPLDAVTPGVPAALPPLPDDGPADRLALARWLVDPAHPLTARVTVNRYWQMHFGTGLVETASDFGAQGSRPSHPALLDWLATEFVASGWDVKAMHRLMVTSATYRQSARGAPGARERDPDNRLLARGPRFRLDAETIRDQALAAGGLLVGDIGGPSVRPYQPPGLWKAVAYPDSDTQTFMRDDGAALYRRSMYTFWKRTSPPPSMLAFDAPSRETCTISRPRTNTPMQVLVLLNDPQFVEAARAIGTRIMTETAGAAAPADGVTFAFRLLTARRPSDVEQAVLRDAFDRQLAGYRADTDAARALIDVGDSAPDPALDPAELAAWTNLAAIIMNLDEVLTKG